MSTRSRLMDAHLESIHGYLVRLRTSVGYFRQSPREYVAWIDEMLDQLRAMDARLSGAKEDFQNLLWSLADGLLVLDGEGRVANANPLATRLMGASLDALRGAPLRTLATDELRLFEGLPGSLLRGYRRAIKGRATSTSEAFEGSITTLDSGPEEAPRGYVVVLRPERAATQPGPASTRSEEAALELERELTTLRRALAATEQEVERLRAALTAAEPASPPPPLPDEAYQEAWIELEATRAALGQELLGVRQALADAQAERREVEARACEAEARAAEAAREVEAAAARAMEELVATRERAARELAAAEERAAIEVAAAERRAVIDSLAAEDRARTELVEARAALEAERDARGAILSERGSLEAEAASLRAAIDLAYGQAEHERGHLEAELIAAQQALIAAREAFDDDQRRLEAALALAQLDLSDARKDLHGIRDGAEAFREIAGQELAALRRLAEARGAAIAAHDLARDAAERRAADLLGELSAARAAFGSADDAHRQELARAEALAAALAEARGRADAAEVRLEELRARAEAADHADAEALLAEVAELRGALEGAADARDELADQLEAREVQLLDAENALALLRDELEASVAAVTAELRGEREQLALVTAERDEAMALAEEEMRAASVARDALEAHQRDLSSTREEVAITKEAAHSTIRIARDRLVEAQADVNRQVRRIAEVEEENARLRAELAGRGGAAVPGGSAPEALEEIVTLRTERAKLIARMQDLEAGEAEREARLETTDAENAELRQLLAEAVQRLDDDELQLDGAARAAAAREEEASRLRMENERLREALDAARTRIRERPNNPSELQRLRSEIEMAQRREERLQESLDRAKLRGEETMKEVERTRRDAQRLERQLAELEERHAKSAEVELAKSRRLEQIIDIAEKTHLADQQELARLGAIVGEGGDRLTELEAKLIDRATLAEELELARSERDGYRAKLREALHAVQVGALHEFQSGGRFMTARIERPNPGRRLIAKTNDLLRRTAAGGPGTIPPPLPSGARR